MVSRMQRVFAVVLMSGFVGMTSAQKTSAVPDQLIYVRCGTLIDGTAGQPRSNVTVVVKNDRIAEIRDGITDAAQSTVVDLSHQTCLPGLIDTHTHVLLQGDITAADYDEQLLKTVIRIPRDPCDRKRTSCAGIWLYHHS